jgi:hypothetical protein
MRKNSETDSATLHVTGGQLALTDFGGGSLPLLARVGMTATVWDVATETFVWVGGTEVTLVGRGGTPDTETFQYFFDPDADGPTFVVDDSDYHEIQTVVQTPIGPFVNVYDAVLDIRRQDIQLDLSLVCVGCEFYLNINSHGLAENPGGESAANAYFRDPLHIGNPDPNLGASFLELSGLTVLPWQPMPVPEPPPLAGLAALAGWLLTRRSITGHTARRWSARASSIPRKSTKRC